MVMYFPFDDDVDELDTQNINRCSISMIHERD